MLSAILGCQVVQPTPTAPAPAPTPTAPTANAPTANAPTATAADWPMYLHDPLRTAASKEAVLRFLAAQSLRPLWTFKTGGTIAASPTIVDGTVYLGSWDGYEYALDASTGALIWKTFLGITTGAPGCYPLTLGITSTAAVANGVVYVGGGDANWYALDAATGSVLWTLPTGDNSPAGGHYNWASPLIVGNSAYIGIASLGDCPLVQGQLRRVDLTTHRVVATVSFVPTGQVGGGIWTSPTIDVATNTVFVTTGTLNQVPQPLSEAVVALDATTLAIKNSWQIPRSASNADSDWGTAPVLISDAGGRALVAAINKNGFLYTFDRSNLALGPVWSRQVAIGGICPTCGDGSVSSMAFAQGLLFVAGGNTTIGRSGYPGAIRAIDLTAGGVVWEHGLADPVVPALAYDNGMVFAGVGPRLEVFGAADGNRLFSYQTGGTIFGPPSISNGTVFIGSGDASLRAFHPGTATVPPPDAACPSGWTCQDIGSPRPAGSESVINGTWTVPAGGAGIGASSGADQIRFMSQPASGDTQITARVSAASEVSGGTQTGLMVRQTNDAASPFYAVSLVAGQAVIVQSRAAFGGAITAARTIANVLPIYIEIQRVGDTFTAATSADGSNYALVPGSTATLALPTQAMAGIVSASGVDGTAALSSTDTVTLGPLGSAPQPPPTPSPCPPGWSCSDVGNPDLIGDQSVSAGTWTLKGAGGGATNYADQFHFVSQGFVGDGTLSARIVVQQNTDPSAQEGLIFRDDALTTDAAFYGAFLTPGGGFQVAYRPRTGIHAVTLVHTARTSAEYLQITRWRTTYTAFTSLDGSTWSPIIGSSVTFGRAGMLVGGLFASSGTGGTVATDTMDIVSTSASASPPPSLCPTGWNCDDIGFPTPPGSQYSDANTWTIQAGGHDIWDSWDAFHFLTQPLAGSGSVSARVNSQTNTSPWAKAGVMLRATMDPRSAYYAAFVTPGHGVAVQWRSTAGAMSSQLLAAGTTPVWLKVARSAGTFSAYTSGDGVTWTAIPGSVVRFGLKELIQAGVAATSANGTALSIVMFDLVTIAH